MKFLILISSLFAVAMASPQPLVQRDCLAEKELCAGFAGPVGKCCEGLECRALPNTADMDVSVPLIPSCLQCIMGMDG